MRSWLLLMVVIVVGCSSADPPAPKELTPEQQKEYEAQMQKIQHGEGRSPIPVK
jgi:hypothetical protein